MSKVNLASSKKFTITGNLTKQLIHDWAACTSISWSYDGSGASGVQSRKKSCSCLEQLLRVFRALQSSRIYWCTQKHESTFMIMFMIFNCYCCCCCCWWWWWQYVNIHNFLLAAWCDLDFLFLASSKQIGEAQDIIDNPSRSTVGGKRSDKYVYHV